MLAEEQFLQEIDLYVGNILEQIEQISSSVRFLHSLQLPTEVRAALNDSLSLIPPGRFFSKRNRVIRCADLGPTPGRHLKASIS